MDGRACDVIYADDDEEVQLLVNPDGRLNISGMLKMPRSCVKPQ
jgi:hypothetical protein